MTRINVYASDDPNTEPYEIEKQLLGHFDRDKATYFPGETYWDGDNHACVHLRDYSRFQNLYRTAGGRWVIEQTSRWQREQTKHWFITDEQAREWLIVNEADEETLERYFGEQPDEEGPNLGGRPEVGPKIEVRLPQDILDQLDARAQAEGVKRAEMVRRLLAAALTA
jgi:hypothetical protein